MTIAEFLLARIAEDESAARLAGNIQAWRSDTHGTYLTRDGKRFLTVDLDAAGAGEYWNYAARHFPARVLAECAAKRAIVEKRLAIGLPDRPIDGGQAWLSGAHEAVDAERGHILRTLAAVYADHPDYAPEWAL